MNMRLNRVLLTLWDIARDAPNYDRRLWGELQHHLSQLQTRNNMLCALLSDLLHCTDGSGNIIWEEATIHSPPGGYAIKFMQEELERMKRPKMPKPPVVIPTNELGEAVTAPYEETRAAVRRPPPLPERGSSARAPRITPESLTKPSDAEERLIDDLTIDYGLLNPSPIVGGGEYDDEDESEEDELAFDFSGSDDTTT